ncbi:MAG: PP2C family protein-serine/threonine phosphatase [Thermoleophilaceae bacterium]
MLPHGPQSRLWARRSTARAGATAAVAGILAVAGATAALAKDDDAKVPPGQAKKLGQGVSALGRSAPAGPVPKAAAPAKAAKPAPAGKAKAPKPQAPARPPQAGGPKKTLPSAPAPPPRAAPSASAPAATPVDAAPASPAATTPPPARTRDRTAATRPGRRAGAPDRRERRSLQRRRAHATPAERAASAVRVASATVTRAEPSTDSGAPASRGTAGETAAAADREAESTVVRTVRDIVEVVPVWAKLALVALAALSLLLAGGYAVSAVRTRSLARQRGELLRDVGMLQSALLPSVPDKVGALATSVAYRPADGPAAGGDFYDALALADGRAAFILGDVSGHGRDALDRTAFMRYTLRAYVEAGLEPRMALQVAGRVIDDRLDGDFATVVIAVHDPRDGSLTYAAAGHPAPIFTGGSDFQPVLAGSSPPIGIGEQTGLRQSTVPLMPGAVACLFTDGLVEARTANGLLGRERLQRIVADLGREATAAQVLAAVAAEARTGGDDMATCVMTPTAGVTTGGFRTEVLELSADEAAGPLPGRFLDECDIPPAAREQALAELSEVAGGHGGGVLSVVLGNRRTVAVLPSNVESIEAAAHRAAARA